MDYDSDLTNVGEGYYGESLNIKIKSDGSSNGYVPQNFVGNKLVGMPNGVGSFGNRVWGIADDVNKDPLDDYTLSLYDDTHTTLLATATGNTIFDLITNFNAALVTAGITHSNQYYSPAGLFVAQAIIEITQTLYYKYILEAGTISFGFFYLIQESNNATDGSVTNAQPYLVGKSKFIDGAYIVEVGKNNSFARLTKITQDPFNNQNLITERLWETDKWNTSKNNDVSAVSEPQGNGTDTLYWSSEIDNIRSFSLFRDPNNIPIPPVSQMAGYLTNYHVLKGGLYTLESINEETVLIKSGDLITDFVEQSLTGGAITSGAWRYGASAIPISVGNEIVIGALTNEVIVYKESNKDGYKYAIGDLSGTITTKYNTLEITNIVPNLYSDIVLYGIHYSNGAVVCYRIKQVPIGETDVSVTIQHLGTEISEIVPIGTVNAINYRYDTAKTLAIIDNYLTATNLTKVAPIDLSEFFASVEHNIQKNELSNQTGQYRNPNNVVDKVGCMVNETYRLAASVMYANGIWSDQVYWIDDIRIDGNATTNEANPTDNRRVAGGITDVSITVSTNNVYYFYPNLIFDWLQLIDGVPAYQVIKKIRIHRAEVVNPRVIASGLLVPMVDVPSPSPAFSPSTTGSFIQNPLVSGRASTSTDTDYITGGYDSTYDSESSKQYFTFHAPDYYFLGNKIDFGVGDSLLFEQTPTVGAALFVNEPAKQVPSSYKVIYGNVTTPLTKVISEAEFCTTGGLVDIGVEQIDNTIIGGLGTFVNYQCMALELSTTSNITTPFATIAYWIRERADQYGDKSLTRYIYTGTEAETSIASNVSVPAIGGFDTFTQFTYLKQRVGLVDSNFGSWNNSGVGFCAQNRINAEMRVRNGTQKLAEDGRSYDSLAAWLSNIEPEAYSCDLAYSIYRSNQIRYYTSYNNNVQYLSDFKQRAIWSSRKPIGSLIDSYGIFPPLNFKDFNSLYGEVSHHNDCDTVMVVFQPTKVSFQYFNSEGALSTIQGDAIILGQNAVMSREAQALTVFGSRNPAVKGVTENGKDCLVWVSVDYKKIMYYSVGNIKCLSDEYKMKSWCEQYVSGLLKDYPNSASGNGISMIWNQKDKEFIITLTYPSVSVTVSYNMLTKGFVSFYSFVSPMYVPYLDGFLSTKYGIIGSGTTTALYLHNDDVVTNTYVPTIYDDRPESYITIITNKYSRENKIFQNFDAQVTNPIYKIEFTTKTGVGEGITAGDYEYALDTLRGQICNVTTEAPLNGMWLKSKVILTQAGTLNTLIIKLLAYTVKFIKTFRPINR